MDDDAEPTEKAVSQLIELYKTQEKRLEKLEGNLQLIERDLEFMTKKKYKLHFAVDFEQIFEFAFPISAFVPQTESFVPDSRKRTGRINRHIARTFVFYRLRPHPLLLPPHAAELDILLNLFVTAQISFEIELHTLREWGNTYLTADKRELIENANKWFKENPQGNPSKEKWYRQLVRFLYGSYRDLLYLTTGLMTHGTKIIDDLLYSRKPKLRFCKDVFPEYQDIVTQVLKSRGSKWFDLFQEVRGKWQSDMRDSKAIDIICALNEALARDKRKERIFLISDAPSMYRVLNWDRTDQIENKAKERFREKGYPVGTTHLEDEEVRLLREIEVFLFFLLHEESTPEKTIERIRASKDLAERYLSMKDRLPEIERICQMVDPVCSDCQPPTECSQLSNKLREAEEFYSNLQTMELTKREKRDMIMEPYEISDADVRLEKSVRSIVDFLVNKSDSFEKMVHDEKQKFEEAFDVLVKDIQENVQDISKGLYLGMGYRLSRIYGIPYRIKFRKEISDLISDLIQAVFREEEGTDIRETKKKSRLLMEFCNDPSMGEDRYLLNAVLCYCYGKYHEAIRMVEDRLKREGNELESEYLYVKVISHLNLSIEQKDRNTFKKALAEATNAYDKYGEADMRFLNLKAAIILEGVDHSLKEDANIDEAIDILRGGLKRMEESSIVKKNERNLRFTLVNNYVYGIVLKDKMHGTTEEERDDAYKEIDALSVEFEDLPNFPDIEDTRVWSIIMEIKYLDLDDMLKIKDLYKKGKEIIEHVLELSEKRHLPLFKKEAYGRTLEELEETYNRKGIS